MPQSTESQLRAARMKLDRLDPFFSDEDYVTPASARHYPAVLIMWTADGVTTERTVPVSVVPDMVDIGSRGMCAGVIIQPEYVACAFPAFSDVHAEFVAECVAYAWNEGETDSDIRDTFPRDFGDVSDDTDNARLAFAFNTATRAECDAADPRADMPAIPADWIDASEKNDAAPCFVVREIGNTPDDGARWVVWVNPADPACRDCGPDSARYAVVRESYDGHDPETIIESDDWSDILRAVARIQSAD